MIAADSSTLIDFLAGVRRSDTDKAADALHDGQLVLPPVVATELLSFPEGADQIAIFVENLPLLALPEGYWIRAGETRRILIRKKLKARMADALIAQACIDANVPLIARDGDFRHFATYCRLKLA